APHVDYCEDVSPVDFVAKALCAISTKPEEINRQFHLLDPHPVHYRDLFKFLQKLGYPIRITDPLNWRQTLLKTSIETGEEALHALTPLFSGTDFLQSGEACSFDNSNLIEALQGSRIKCPKISMNHFKKYVDYYVKTGFFPRPRSK
ncbi:MAG: hypothetical protein KGI83_01405, partial [Verrucomicrobiota bacterium]|nr:hypothetical protein [Verrucomicrobiota bacterium]